MLRVPTSSDNLLFTPGPLTTSKSVKNAMLYDLGSRDFDFINTVKEIRNQLLCLAKLSSLDYSAVLIQGSGTYSVESVISSFVPKNSRLLVIINGAYGYRISAIAKAYSIDTLELIFEETQIPDLEMIENALINNPDISLVAVVHCETTTGILNPVEEIGRLVKRYNKSFFVDSMSAFGAVEFDFQKAEIDFLVSSANKNIEGVPGFSFVIAKKQSLLACKNNARSFSLDLYAQYESLESSGQFRFTPPTHCLLAFKQALIELEQEGGIKQRALRYKNNKEVLSEGMRNLGFKELLPKNLQSVIISSFIYPDHENFNFEIFYRKLNALGIVIYPGKTSKSDCFRIGSIGRLFEKDFIYLILAIRKVLNDMKVVL